MTWQRPITLLILQVATIRSWHTCTVRDIERCMLPIQQFTQHTIFPSYSDNQLKNVCGSFREMQKCLEPIKPACTQAEVRVYEGIEKACTFLCRDGLDQYLVHRICFAGTGLATEGSQCNTTYSQQMQHAFDMSQPIHVRRQNVCQDTDKFMKCIRQAVARHCGDEAASWVNHINIKVFHPFMEEVGCSFDTSRMPVAIILGVAMAVLVLILAIIITSIICRRKRRMSTPLSMNRLNTCSSVDGKKVVTRSDLLFNGSPRKSNIYGTSPVKQCGANVRSEQKERAHGTEAVKLLHSCAADNTSQDFNMEKCGNGDPFDCDVCDENERNQEAEKQREPVLKTDEQRITPNEETRLTDSRHDARSDTSLTPLLENAPSNTNEHTVIPRDSTSRDTGEFPEQQLMTDTSCPAPTPPDDVCPRRSNIYEEEVERALEPRDTGRLDTSSEGLELPHALEESEVDLYSQTI